MNAINLKMIITAIGAVVGLILAVILPGATGLSDSVAAAIGMLVFGGTVFGFQFYMEGTDLKEQEARLARIEEENAKIRTELEKTRKDVSQKTKSSDAKNDKVVAELKLLQTLLGQVMKKEMALKSGGIKGSTASKSGAKSATKAGVQKTGQRSASVRKEVSTAGFDDLDTSGLNDDEDDVILEGESETTAPAPTAASNGASSPAPAQRSAGRQSPQKKAPIRLIKKEDQLLAVIQNSLAENRVDLYLQGIVGLPSRKITHFECYSRVRDEEGRIVLPRQYIRLAEAKGLIGTIDNLLLFRLIQLVRRLGPRRPDIRFFCNLSLHSMRDAEFFPQFIDFMQANEEFASRLVFEISQDDFNGLEEDVTDQLARLGRRGFGFSMDHVSVVDDSLMTLNRQHFQFVKMDMNLISKTMETNEVQELVRDLRQRGISLIGSRVEAEDMILQALDAGIELAQGYLFGEPRAASDLNREL